MRIIWHDGAVRVWDTAQGELVKRGTIRAYGWSTDFPERATAFATASPSVTAVQHDFSVLKDSPEVLAVCERLDLPETARDKELKQLIQTTHIETLTKELEEVRDQQAEGEQET